jgi:metal-responsive CopG/Arc/MetJ family transcriptional regulator
MRRTNIYLDDRQTEALDRLAADEGVSRAEIVRRLIDQALAGEDQDLDGDLRAINESYGALADVEPPVREPDARAEHLDAMWRLGA